MKSVLVYCLGIVLLLPALVWGSNKAGVVIQNSTGAVITRCVEFEEAEISVEELLRRSGFKMVTAQSTYGTLLHYLHDDGVMDGSFHDQGWFWNFFQQEESGWVSASVGISSATAVQGSLVGFVFGAWGEVQLPLRAYSDVCEITSRAGVVVDHSNGDRTVKVVEFPGETFTGLQVLQRSGLRLVTRATSFGTAICAIDNEGQPEENCFGDLDGRYWGFNVLLPDGRWESSPQGVDDVIARDADVLGFQFGTWGAIQPPITRQEIFELPSGVRFWGEYWR